MVVSLWHWLVSLLVLPALQSSVCFIPLWSRQNTDSPRKFGLLFTSRTASISGVSISPGLNPASYRGRGWILQSVEHSGTIWTGAKSSAWLVPKKSESEISVYSHHKSKDYNSTCLFPFWQSLFRGYLNSLCFQINSDLTQTIWKCIINVVIAML